MFKENDPEYLILKEKFTTALNKFVNDEIQKPEVIGIFVTGSYVFDKLRPNSDLDVFVVTSGKTMQILARYYNDVEIECCYKPLKQYFYDLEVKKNDFDIQRFSNVLILYDPDLQLEKIVTKAKEIYKSGPNRTITDSDLYHFNDVFLDLEDSINEPTFKINIYKCFEQVMKLYFKKNNLWQCKEKYYIDYISNFDLEFSKKIRNFLLEDNYTEQYKLLLKIKEEVLENIPKLDKDWKKAEIAAEKY